MKFWVISSVIALKGLYRRAYNTPTTKIIHDFASKESPDYDIESETPSITYAKLEQIAAKIVDLEAAFNTTLGPYFKIHNHLQPWFLVVKARPFVARASLFS